MRRFLLAAVMLSCMPAALCAAPPELPLLPLPAAVTPQAGSFLFAGARIDTAGAGSIAAESAPERPGRNASRVICHPRTSGISGAANPYNNERARCCELKRRAAKTRPQ